MMVVEMMAVLRMMAVVMTMMMVLIDDDGGDGDADYGGDEAVMMQFYCYERDPNPTSMRKTEFIPILAAAAWLDGIGETTYAPGIAELLVRTLAGSMKTEERLECCENQIWLDACKHPRRGPKTRL